MDGRESHECSWQ